MSLILYLPDRNFFRSVVSFAFRVWLFPDYGSTAKLVDVEVLRRMLAVLGVAIALATACS
jgi:hypothetical protein